MIATNRGGRITYHGPGQLVGYPIMAIDGRGCILRRMEKAIVAALAARASRRTLRSRRAPTTQACGSRTARSPRSACTSPRRHHARFRGQRRKRPSALLLGGRLRPARRADDIVASGDRATSRHAPDADDHAACAAKRLAAQEQCSTLPRGYGGVASARRPRTPPLLRPDATLRARRRRTERMAA